MKDRYGWGSDTYHAMLETLEGYRYCTVLFIRDNACASTLRVRVVNTMAQMLTWYVTNGPFAIILLYSRPSASGRCFNDLSLTDIGVWTSNSNIIAVHCQGAYRLRYRLLRRTSSVFSPISQPFSACNCRR